MTEDIYELIVESRRQGRRAALATIVSRKGSTPRKDPAKILVFEDGQQIGSIGGGCTEAEVCREALQVMRSEKPKLLSFELTDDDAEDSAMLCGGTMEVYVEPILPDPTLFIFGAGHVGQCIAAVAHTLGFKLGVIDDRIKFASQDRFPKGTTFYVEPWDTVFGKLPVNSSSYLVIATRGHQYDLVCLRFGVHSPAKYIGLLGSKRKTKLLFEVLEKEGVDPATFERVFAPIGIEIGSETPEEIAISVAAELVGVRKQLNVRPLKEKLRGLKPVTTSLSA